MVPAPERVRWNPLPPLVLVAGGLALGCFLDTALVLGDASAWRGLAACVAAGLLALWRDWLGLARVALVLASVSLGLVWVQPAPPLPTQLWEGPARVTRVLWHAHSQGALVALADAPVSTALAVLPVLPGLQVDDRLWLRGRLQADTWQGQQRARLVVVEVASHTPRTASTRGWAWRALAELPEHADLAAALLLGQERPQSAPAFRQAGLAHLLAVSGLHIGFALILVHLLLHALPLPWWLRPGLVLAACAGYVWLTSAPLPTQRAALMVAVWQVGLLSARRLEPLAVLAWAVFVLLLLHPEDGRAIGFQLSVAAVAGIVSVGRMLLTVRQDYCPLRPWPLDRPLWRGVLWCARSTLDGLAIGLSASLATAPLIAWHFQVVTPWGVVATLLAGPLTALVLVAGLPWLILRLLWEDGPWYGFQVALQWSLAGLEWMAQWAASWPGASQAVARPPLWLLVCCVLAGVVGASYQQRAKAKPLSNQAAKEPV